MFGLKCLIVLKLMDGILYKDKNIGEYDMFLRIASVAIMCGQLVYAGEVMIPATVASVEVSSPVEYYVEGALGSFSLEDKVTSEELSVKTGMLGAGIAFSPYIALEARYYRGIGNQIDFDSGATSSPDKVYDSTFTNLSVFAKFSYPAGRWTPYVLWGYGSLKLTNIEGGDREERAMQYGVGVRYKTTEHLSVFVDWVRTYDDKGFDGRAKNDDISIDLVSVGITYRF